MFRRILLLFVILSVGYGSAVASWKLVTTLNNQVFCGYFFNEQHGLIGCGNVDKANRNSCLDIFYTYDGGNSWQQSKTPKGYGYITSIFMVDSLIGYASLLNTPLFSLWKTTDAGITWQDATNNNFVDAPCVYVTSKAITRTEWHGNGGGSSTNQGFTFSQVFKGEFESRSNGIDFLDDLNGIVTMGPDRDQNSNGNVDVNTYNTTDGGVSWNIAGKMREAWGVYADKLTRTYFALAEDYQSTPGQILYWTIDAGRNWQCRCKYL